MRYIIADHVTGSAQSKYNASDAGKARRKAYRKQAPAAKQRKRQENREYRQRELWLGIDGEGQGRRPHRYTLLAVSDAESQYQRWVTSDSLSTIECLDFILGMPERARLFAYFFRYDLTLILKDLDDSTLYRLMRPEVRPGKRGPLPVIWGEYVFNYVGTKFTVRRGKRSRTIWDVGKFFQGPFVSALKDWQIPADPVVRAELLKRMQAMKDQRGDFENISDDQILGYCLEECACMAALAAKLTNAHEQAGLELTNYYGAGSTASALLKKLNVEQQLRDPPDAMREAVACAFFGGRFENSVLGPVPGPVYSYDISSAYPYQLYQLPCLIHGRWEHTTKESDLEGVQHALVRYSYDTTLPHQSWAPFPFREKDGTISYPSESGGGWVYASEFRVARAHFANIRFNEAWVCQTYCSCVPVFQEIPRLYRERIRIGKEGPGIVIKLGMNSCYGKLAQSVGNAPFQSWIWAGMITSGTRAQLLEFIALHQNPANCLMVATDGVFSLEDLTPPTPIDTGTFDLEKPLGGWEKKVIQKGIFAARPGVYFPLEPTLEELKEVRARGLGKGLMLEQWPKVVSAYNAGTQCQQPGCIIPTHHAHMAKVPRFIGAKTGTHLRAGEAVRSEDYGQWVEREVILSLDPKPKRELALDGTLQLRRFPIDQFSAPYSNVLSEEAVDLRMTEQEESEQPL